MNHESNNQTIHPPQINLRLGQLVATPGALEAMARVGQDPAELLARHQSGDWGEVGAADAAANTRAAIEGDERISIVEE